MLGSRLSSSRAMATYTKANALLADLVYHKATQRVITLLGKKLLTIFIGDYDYEGEIDEQGKACGYGIAVNIKETDSRWEGTF